MRGSRDGSFHLSLSALAQKLVEVVEVKTYENMSEGNGFRKTKGKKEKCKIVKPEMVVRSLMPPFHLRLAISSSSRSD